MNIHEYPTQIESKAIELATIADDLAAVRDRIKDAETEAMADVMEARGEDGKPLHTNERAREIAIHRALSGQLAYTQDCASERILELRKAEIGAQIERLRREYSIALIDHEAERLGRRHAA